MQPRSRRMMYACLILLALLPFQNCGQGFKGTETSSSTLTATASGGTGGADVGLGGTGGTGGTTVTTTTTTTTMSGVVVQPCDRNQVGSPVMTPSPVIAATVLSGQGAKGGRIGADPMNFVYASISAPSNCSKDANLTFQIIENTVTSMNNAGVRTAAPGNALTRQVSGGTAPGSTQTVRFNANDNDTDMQCMEGVVKYRVFLTSVADPNKKSGTQDVTVTYKNNCLPEAQSKPLTGALDAYDQLGMAVAIDGSTAAVLATGDDGASNTTTDVGAVYIFKKSGANTWALTQTLRAPDSVAGDSPSSLSLKNGILAFGSELSANKTGAVYVFRENATEFVYAGKIAGPAAGSRFGRAVAVSGSYLVVGSPGESTSAGAVYIYDSASLNLRNRIAAPTVANTYFGAAVAIEGSLLAVGAPGSTLARDSTPGALVIYQESGGNWSEVNNVLRSSTLAMGSEIGTSVAIYNGTIIVGAPGALNGNTKTGNAFLIGSDRSKSTPVFDSAANSDGARYGAAVAIGSAGIFVGSTDIRTRGGAVYHFTYSGTTVTFGRQIVAQQGADNDQFGGAVGTSGTSLVVGARVNSDPNNTSGSISFISTVVP